MPRNKRKQTKHDGSGDQQSEKPGSSNLHKRGDSALQTTSRQQSGDQKPQSHEQKSRVRTSVSLGQQEEGPPPPKETASSGPPPSLVQQQQHPPPPRGAWASGPRPYLVQQQQHPPPPREAWSSGPPPSLVQQQQHPPPPRGAWASGPRPYLVQQQQHPPPPREAWSSGPRPSIIQQQQHPPPPRGAWASGPPPYLVQQQQHPPPPRETWESGPPPSLVQQQQHPTQSVVKKETSSDEPKEATSSVIQKSSHVTPKTVTVTDKNLDKKDKQQPSELKEYFTFAKRIDAPKKSGKPIVVATNFFTLTIQNPNIVIYHYNVIIEPDKPKNLLRAVWNKFSSLVFPGRYTAFDGKNAYSKGPLTKDGASCSSVVTVNNDMNNKDKEFKVTIEKVREISLSYFQDFRKRMLQDSSFKILPEAETSVLEIIMQNYASDNFIKSNRQFFLPSSKKPPSVELSNTLCLRKGYYQAAFLGYKLYLNFDLSYKCFYKETSLLNILDAFRMSRGNDFNIDGINHYLRTVKVKYEIPNDPSSRRIFRCYKLVNNANNVSFQKKDGSSVCVADYFAKEKKYPLKYPDLPLLQVEPSDKSIYLPLELCTITPDQIYRGFIDAKETRLMVQNATANARDRKKETEQLFHKTNINSHPLMQEFGLRVSKEMEKVPAHVLDPPVLNTQRRIQVKDGTWNINNFLDPVRLGKWCILNLDGRLHQQSVIILQNMLKSKGQELNMKIGDPVKHPIAGNPNFRELKLALSKLKDMEIVFVIIPDTKGVYAKVKTICETQEGILTQCIKSRTVSQDPRKLTATVQNILLKVNAKLGGKNHCLDRSSTPHCLDGYVMIVGADVTHPSPGMKIPSVAAVTVSCDPSAFQYATTTRVQVKGEMIRDLQEIMTIHLKRFYEKRRHYPDKIIFFRDGVSEGELVKVFKEELSALKKACDNYCQPKITFVIVQKRHHTRLYPTCANDEQGRNFNVPVGTCVDTDIVHPRDLDFYLVSHSSILGTARPTRYRLIYDDNKLTNVELEELSYYLCHLFSRCNRSVSYPSPTYNAHLAAARVRSYLEALNISDHQDIEEIRKKMPDYISQISPMFFV